MVPSVLVAKMGPAMGTLVPVVVPVVCACGTDFLVVTRRSVLVGVDCIGVG